MVWPLLLGIIFAACVIWNLCNIADEVRKIHTTVESWARIISKDLARIEADFSSIEMEMKNAPSWRDR